MMSSSSKSLSSVYRFVSNRNSAMNVAKSKLKLGCILKLRHASIRFSPEQFIYSSTLLGESTNVADVYNCQRLQVVVVSMRKLIR